MTSTNDEDKKDASKIQVETADNESVDELDTGESDLSDLELLQIKHDEHYEISPLVSAAFAQHPHDAQKPCNRPYSYPNTQRNGLPRF